MGRVKGTRKGPDKGKWLYKVKFKGYPEVSTIPERNFVDKDMLNDFKTRFTKTKDRQLFSIPEEPVLDPVEFAASGSVLADSDGAGTVFLLHLVILLVRRATLWMQRLLILPVLLLG